MLLVGIDHVAQGHRLARIEGQIKGIGRMIEERRYCIDIVQQLTAMIKVEKAGNTVRIRRTS